MQHRKLNSCQLEWALQQQCISQLGFHSSGSFCFHVILSHVWGFPGVSDGKESACNIGDLNLISGSGRSPGEGNGNPLQYSCLENPMDRGAWWAAVHWVTKESDTTERVTFYFFSVCGTETGVAYSYKDFWLTLPIALCVGNKLSNSKSGSLCLHQSNRLGTRLGFACVRCVHNRNLLERRK